MRLHLEVFPPAQRQLWSELGSLPPDFVLYGGTAIALQLGHRTSVDFDFFGGQDLPEDSVFAQMPLLQSAEILRREPNTLVFRLKRVSQFVQVSFFGTPTTRQLRPPTLVPEPRVRIASLLDLAATKASVVQQRAEAKDYVDLDALISAGVDLPQILAAAKMIFGARFNPLATLKALSYFDDGDLAALPAVVRLRLHGAVRALDLGALPDVGGRAVQIGSWQ